MVLLAVVATVSGAAGPGGQDIRGLFGLRSIDHVSTGEVEQMAAFELLARRREQAVEVVGVRRWRGRPRQVGR